MMGNRIALFIILFGSLFAMAQTEEQKKFIELYKANYLEWISSPEIALMQERNPELKALIETVPVQQTEAYKDAIAKTQTNRKNGIDVKNLLGGDAKKMSMDVIKQLFMKENTDVVINLYWEVIKSAETQEIIDLIMPHVLKAKQDFETAGVDLAGQIKG